MRRRLQIVRKPYSRKGNDPDSAEHQRIGDTHEHLAKLPDHHWEREGQRSPQFRQKGLLLAGHGTISKPR